MTQKKPGLRWRHLAVAVGIIPATAVYILICLVAADIVTGYHGLLDGLFYLAAGLVWIYPASKVIGWLAQHEAE